MGHTPVQMQVYGMTVEDIQEHYMESMTAKVSGMEMVVAGILSDCQEMIAMRNPTIPSPHVDESIRQRLNVAKYILFTMLKETV